MRILNLLKNSIVFGSLSGGIIGAGIGVEEGVRGQLKDINNYTQYYTYVVSSTCTIGSYGLIGGGIGVLCGMVWPVSVGSALVFYFKHN